MYLRETVPAGPKAEAEAKRILAGFVHEVYERRTRSCDGAANTAMERRGSTTGPSVRTSATNDASR